MNTESALGSITKIQTLSTLHTKKCVSSSSGDPKLKIMVLAVLAPFRAPSGL